MSTQQDASKCRAVVSSVACRVVVLSLLVVCGLTCAYLLFVEHSQERSTSAYRQGSESRNAFESLPIPIGPIAVVETSPEMFLFGTAHTRPSDCADLLDPVLDLIDKVDCIYMEYGETLLLDLCRASMSDDRFQQLEPSERSRLHDLRGVVVLDQDMTLRDVLPAEILTELTSAAERSGLPKDFILSDTGAVWSYLFGVFPEHPTPIMYVASPVRMRAFVAGVPVYDLESLDIYIDVFGPLTTEQQIELLDCKLKAVKRDSTSGHESFSYDDILNEFIRHYVVDGRVTPHWKIDFFRRLLDDRNQKMFERIKPSIGERSILVIVGAAHMGGDHGLINCFRRAGYHVRIVESE